MAIRPSLRHRSQLRENSRRQYSARCPPASPFASRRGIELSINFLVTFILAIVLFGLGILLAKNLFSGGSDIVEATQSQLDAAIESMTCTPSDLVCVNVNAKTLERGGSYIFGALVRNVLPQDEFTVTIRNTKFISKDNAVTEFYGIGGELTGDEAEMLDILYEDQPFTLDKNQEKRLGFLIKAKSTNPKGKYIVDIAVTCSAQDCDGDRNPGGRYDVIHKIYVTVI